MLNKHLLVELGWKRFNAPKEKDLHFVPEAEANAQLNDLKRFPHIFVLACLMDKQIKAERAWMIPWRVGQKAGGHDIKRLGTVSLDEYRALFIAEKLHRFNDTMAEVFYLAVHRILKQYDGDASRIWSGKPSSAAVVRRFLEFKGGGVKIATMSANILARGFRIPFADYNSIDVSPDVHVRRVMARMGLAPEEASPEVIIYVARELCPEFPGIIDFPLWEIGRDYCDARTPKCAGCPVRAECRAGQGR